MTSLENSKAYMPKVKICGITNREDAIFCSEHGADALGFNFFPGSPRYILPAQVKEIIAELPASVLRVGVFVNESISRILQISEMCKLDAIQLHGDEDLSFVSSLREKTSLQIIKVFRINQNEIPEEIRDFNFDAILLDSYSDVVFGGTGKIFNWNVARKIRKLCSTLYLAGGLTAENVRSAIREVDPFAVDVCSGVEKEKGKKDFVKVQEFIKNAKGVFANEF